MADFDKLVADYLIAAREQAGRMHVLAVSGTPEDLGSLRLWAHRLRGSGQSFGFPEITRVAGRIEDLAVATLSGDATPPPLLVLLCEELRGVADRARSGREGEPAPARPGTPSRSAGPRA